MSTRTGITIVLIVAALAAVAYAARLLQQYRTATA